MLTIIQYLSPPSALYHVKHLTGFACMADNPPHIHYSLQVHTGNYSDKLAANCFIRPGHVVARSRVGAM